MAVLRGIRGAPITRTYRYSMPGNAGDALYILRNNTGINNSGGQVAIKVIDLSATTSGDGVITVEGESVTVPFNTDIATTASDIVTAIQNNSFISKIVKAEVNSTDDGVILTGRDPYIGFDFSLTVTGYDAVTVVDDGTGDSQVAQDASPIKPGRGVVYPSGETPNTVALPSTSGQQFLGVALQMGQLETSFTGQPEIPAFRPVVYGFQGDYVAVVEAEPAPYDPVYIRHTADGSLTDIGAFAPASGTGLEEIPNAKFVPYSSDNQYATSTSIAWRDQQDELVSVIQLT